MAKPASPAPAFRTSRPRVFAIDWLRMFDVFIVVIGHCIRFLDDKASDVKLSGAGDNAYLNVIMLFGNMWVMPLFFFLAGAAGNLSISSRTTVLGYFVKRVLRIGIPFIGGFFLAVLPYAYISRDYLDCNGTGENDEDMPDSPFSFCAYFFGNCFKVHGFKWLWFLFLLAFMTSIHLPIMFLLKRSVITSDQTAKKALHKKIIITGLCYMLSWSLFCGIALPIRSYLNFGGIVIYFTVTFGHVYIQRFRNYNFSYVMLLLMMMSTHLFIQAEDKTYTSNMSQWLFILMSYINMFLSGFLISLYEVPIALAFQQRRGYLVLSLFNIALFPLLAPVYKDSPDYEFVNGGVYATYQKRDLRILYGAGCYTWVILIYAFARKFLNDKFSDLAYNYFTRSALPLYIIHPTIQYALAIYWFIPYGQHYPPGITFTIMCALTFGLSFAFFTLIDVTPLRFLVGLTGPSPIFPDGLFRPSPLFSDGVKCCKPWCGLTYSDEDEDERKQYNYDPDTSTDEPRTPLNPNGSTFVSRVAKSNIGEAVLKTGTEVLYGTYGLNNLTRVDLIGDRLRHSIDGDESYDLGLEDSGFKGEDHWAVPTTSTWRAVVNENSLLRSRVQHLEGLCDENGVIYEQEHIEDSASRRSNEGCLSRRHTVTTFSSDAKVEMEMTQKKSSDSNGEGEVV